MVLGRVGKWWVNGVISWGFMGFDGGLMGCYGGFVWDLMESHRILTPIWFESPCFMGKSAT